MKLNNKTKSLKHHRKSKHPYFLASKTRPDGVVLHVMEMGLFTSTSCLCMEPQSEHAESGLCQCDKINLK